jgi:hypothetical protein
VAIANPECGYVVGPYFEGENKTDKSSEWINLSMEEGVWSLPPNVTHPELHQVLSKLHWVGAMLCTREVVEKYGGFYAKGGCLYGEDRYLQMQLLLNHKIYRLLKPLVWYHNETNGVSTIEIGPRPLLPILADPEPVRLSCPMSFRPVLEDWLSSHALGYALEYAREGDLSISRDLIRRFPAMRKNKRKFINLICLVGTTAVRGIASLGR